MAAITPREWNGYSLKETLEQHARTMALSKVESWGWLPALAFTSACGVLLLASANASAYVQSEWATAQMYVGLLTIFTPVAARLLSTAPSRRERIGLVLVLALMLYLVKVLRSPVMFMGFDELLHFRTAQDVLRTNHLFHGNSMLPVSPLYPGLELVTTAAMHLSGLPVFQAGVLVVGVARILFALALFLLFEELGRSARVGSIAVLLYTSNLGFVFFDAQFSYESLALPLGVFALSILARRLGRGETGRGTLLAILLTLVAVIVTHHLTSFVLIGFLVLILVMAFLTQQSSAQRMDLVRIVGLAVLAAFTWLTLIAPTVIYYLSPYTVGAVNQMIGLIFSDVVTRPLFVDYAGQANPMWERGVSLASLALSLLALPFGLLEIWRRHGGHVVLPARIKSHLSPFARTEPLGPGAAVFPLALGVASLAYGATQPLRLIPTAAEVASRSAEFLFLAIAFVLTLGPVQRWLATIVTWKRIAAMTLWATILFLGGFILGAGPGWSRLPGPYLVSADLRSIEPEGIAAANWMRTFAGPGNRIAADRVNSLLMVSHGLQRPIADLGDRIDVSLLYFASEFGAEEQDLVDRGNIRYIVVDRRMSTGLPRVGVYFQSVEPSAYLHKTPIPKEALAKFDQVPNMSRVFDSGDIVIYQVLETGRPHVEP